MAEKITYQIDVDKSNTKKAENFYVDTERLIPVEGVMLKICLPRDEFEKLLANDMEVDPAESIDWVKKCVVGRITKVDLDNERVEETNSLDIMQNSSIIYHMESVVEMQLMILIIAYYFSELWAEKQGYGTLTTEEGIFKGTTMESSKTMMYILAAEHVIAYMFGIYREHEIEKVGFIDP